MIEGFLFIDKPAGPTSHDVVDVVRRLISSPSMGEDEGGGGLSPSPRPSHQEMGKLRVGHAGTLDPFATGLLIIAIGKTTKELGKLAGLDKEYEATLALGAVSDTYDRTGKITTIPTPLPLGEEKIKEVFQKFVGTIEQVPPMYSAKKMRGKKLYELARAGIEIERKPITVTIYSIEIGSPLTARRLPLRIRCSSGTYIRTLAHDIGQALNCGAYLEELRRTAIGPFSIEDAMPLTSLTVENFRMHLKSIEVVLEQARTV